MRTLGVIGAAILVACAMPAASRADGPAGTAASTAAPGCKCPGAQKRQVRPRRVVRHRRVAPPPLVMAPPPPVYYNPGLPSPIDTAYGRAMVLHFRSPPVTGLYNPEPGFPPTPPVAAVHSYRVPYGSTVLQYDGLIGDYVQLAQTDPAHQFNVAGAPPPGTTPPQ